MKEHDALGIIKALADGVDPISGEVFPADSPYKHIIVRKALYAAATSLEETVKKKSRKIYKPEQSGKPWDKAESDLLIKNFQEGMKIGELAKEHKRTRIAIEAQLSKLSIEIALGRRK